MIAGALNFNSTEHDSKTLPKAIEQYERLTENKDKNIFVDRGYREPKAINETTICVPKPDNNITKTKRKRHGRRAAIEPVIGNLKSDYRMRRNFFKGVIGDEMNVLLVAVAMYFKRVMNLWRREAIKSWQLIYNFFIAAYWIFIARKVKFTF